MKKVVEKGGAKFPGNKNKKQKEEGSVKMDFEKWLSTETGQALINALPVVNPDEFFAWAFAGEVSEDDIISIFGNPDIAEALYEKFDLIQMRMYEEMYDIILEKREA